MIDQVSAALGTLADNARGALTVVFSAPGSRMYCAWLASFVLLATLSWIVHYRRDGDGTPRALLRFIFPRKVYLHPSARVDYGLYLCNAVVFPATRTFGAALAASVGVWTAVALERRLGGYGDLFAWHGASAAMFTVAAALAADFATFAVHALHHRLPLLWEFHKVHHTAEVLTPVTVYRKHPLYDVLVEGARGLLAGLLQGAAAYAFIGRPAMVSLLGINVVYALFHIAGSNLRHSHIWLSFGRAASHVFISPAQHQIHHSTAARHQDKNYGEVFALWDWMFGSLYVPGRREDLVFGIRGAATQEHPTLWKAYTVPFVNCYRLLRQR